MSSDRAGIERTPAGLCWEDQPVGFRLRTMPRTVTEGELMSFVAGMGFLEPLFLDARDETFDSDRRLVPGAMVFALAEGLVIQTRVLDGTGLAFLGTTLRIVAPVFVGDTIDVELEVIESRASSKAGRGVVKTRNRLFNQDDRLVLEYEPVRLIAGRDG